MAVHTVNRKRACARIPPGESSVQSSRMRSGGAWCSGAGRAQEIAPKKGAVTMRSSISVQRHCSHHNDQASGNCKKREFERRHSTLSAFYSPRIQHSRKFGHA